MNITPFSRYIRRAIAQPELEGVLWQWAENPFAALGDTEREAIPYLWDWEESFKAVLQSQGELCETDFSVDITLIAKGAASLGVSEKAGQDIVLSTLPGYNAWLQKAKAAWLVKAKEILGPLPELTVQEALDVLEAERQFDAEENAKDVFEAFGACRWAEAACDYIESTNKCWDWEDYFSVEELDIPAEIQARYAAAVAAQKAAFQQWQAEQKAKQEAAIAAIKAKQSLPNGKPKPRLKRR